MENIIQVSKNKFGFLYSVSSGGCNGFNFELNLLDDNVTKELMNEWGISFRSNSKESDYNSDINN